MIAPCAAVWVLCSYADVLICCPTGCSFGRYCICALLLHVCKRDLDPECVSAVFVATSRRPPWTDDECAQYGPSCWHLAQANLGLCLQGQTNIQTWSVTCVTLISRNQSSVRHCDPTDYATAVRSTSDRQ